MLDGKRISDRLEETGLMMEEFYFLYRLMCQEQNISSGVLKSPGKKESDEVIIRFSQLSERYQQRFQTYLNTGIDWVTIANKLADEDYLEIWKQTNEEIKLTDMRVTEKFKGYFLISDIDAAYTEVLEIWPSWIWVNNVKYSAVDKSPDEMAKLYNIHIMKGNNALLHERFLMITKLYIEQWQKKGAPYKLSKWITEIYENVAIAMEKGEEPTIKSQEI